MLDVVLTTHFPIAVVSFTWNLGDSGKVSVVEGLSPFVVLPFPEYHSTDIRLPYRVISFLINFIFMSFVYRKDRTLDNLKCLSNVLLS